MSLVDKRTASEHALKYAEWAHGTVAHQDDRRDPIDIARAQVWATLAVAYATLAAAEACEYIGTSMPMPRYE